MNDLILDFRVSSFWTMKAADGETDLYGSVITIHSAEDVVVGTFMGQPSSATEIDRLTFYTAVLEGGRIVQFEDMLVAMLGPRVQAMIEAALSS